MLAYLRDFLISLIDIAKNPEFAPVFNLKMALALKVLLEVLETDEIQQKVKDYEMALSYIWKILLNICQ